MEICVFFVQITRNVTSSVNAEFIIVIEYVVHYNYITVNNNLSARSEFANKL